LKGLLSCPLSGYQISGLFVDDLDLLVYHVPGEAVNRHACRAEALAKAGAPSNVIPLENVKAFETERARLVKKLSVH